MKKKKRKLTNRRSPALEQGIKKKQTKKNWVWKQGPRICFFFSFNYLFFFFFSFLVSMASWSQGSIWNLMKPVYERKLSFENLKDKKERLAAVKLHVGMN